MRIETTNTYVCPDCKNDNPSMISTADHRREQVFCHCEVCAHDWIHNFNVTRQNIIPFEVDGKK